MSIRDGMLVNGMGCYTPGWGVCMGWVVSKQD